MFDLLAGHHPREPFMLDLLAGHHPRGPSGQHSQIACSPPNALNLSLAKEEARLLILQGGVQTILECGVQTLLQGGVQTNGMGCTKATCWGHYI